MEVGDGTRPVGVYFGHVSPRDEGSGKGVEEAFFGLVDFGYAEDIVDVADDGEAGGRNEIGSCVADITADGVDVQALDVGRLIPVRKTVAFYVDEGIEITLRCRGVGEFDFLVPTVRCHGSTSTWFTRCSSCRRWLQIEGDVFIALLEDKYTRSKISSLDLLLWV